jgi:hypothetical protein
MTSSGPESGVINFEGRLISPGVVCLRDSPGISPRELLGRLGRVAPNEPHTRRLGMALSATMLGPTARVLPPRPIRSQGQMRSSDFSHAIG